MLDQSILNKVAGLYQSSEHDIAMDSIGQQMYLDRNPVVDIKKSIENHVKNFEKELNPNQEIMVMVASFGSSVNFYIQSIEFNEPNLIIFHGVNQDHSVIRLIQHCNQLNFLLQAVRKNNTDEKRNPIGFIHSM